MSHSKLHLSCPRCRNMWGYSGNNHYVTSCSKFKTSVSIKKNTVNDPYIDELDKRESSLLVLENGGNL